VVDLQTSVLDEIVGPLPLATYQVIHEIPGSSWGYAGHDGKSTGHHCDCDFYAFKPSAYALDVAITRDTAIQKIRMAEDGWNSRDPQRVSLAYTVDTQWRNRAEFAHNREQARDFLTRKWAKELDYRLIKELWAFTDNRIAVRYAYEWHDDSGNWFRSYGNENWEFDENGLMANRFACINDLPIKESERKFHWPLGRRPDEHPGLSDLGL